MGYEFTRPINWGCLPALAFVLFVGVPTLAWFMVGQSMAQGDGIAMPYVLFLAAALAIVLTVGALAALIVWLTNKLITALEDNHNRGLWAKASISIVISLFSVWLGWRVVELVFY